LHNYFMRVGLGQFNAVVGDLAGNAEKMRSIYNDAIRSNVDLLAFPELAVCGYPPEDLLLKKHFLEDCRDIIEKLAADCPKAIIIVGFPESYKNDSSNGSPLGCYNSAAVLQGGKVSKIYRKVLLPNYGVFDERRYFQAGAKPVVIKAAGLNVAITICADVWNIKWLAKFLRDAGQTPPLPQPLRREGLGGAGRVQMVLNISASPFHMDKIKQRQAIISQCAKELNCAACYCNLVGGQDEIVFDGRSMFVDSRGKIAACARAFDEDLLIAEITAANKDVRIEPTPTALLRKAKQWGQPSDSVDEIYQALVLGTRDYTRKNGFMKVLVGLSGGVDSSVTAAIAAAALGAENVLGVTMPSRFNSSATIADAEKIAKNLGIGFLSISIEPILEQFNQSLTSAPGWDSKGIAYENLQARIRGNILMSLSNSSGSLVLTSGNKSETAVGYATLYGDTAGGFAVIKDVLKTVVYKLARHINKTMGREVIPESVISRAPSAELKANQKDSETLPDYDLLDEILKGYVEEDKSAGELIKAGLPPKEVHRIIRMVDRNEYKRRQSPPGVKITPKAFGKDRRLPITNRYSSYNDTM
jgi:NAD+ synthase (glutamine-hydrolysing)